MSFLLALVLILGGCVSESVPEGMDRETLLSSGQQVLLLMVEGDYEAIHSLLREDQRAQTSVEDIRKAIEDQLCDAGLYKQIEDRMVTSLTKEGEHYGVAVMYCEFSEEDVLIRAFFDTQMRLVGFALQQD